MKTLLNTLILLFSSLSVPVLASQIGKALPQSAKKIPLNQLQLPKGFKIEVYAVVPGARSLSLGPDGTLFVGSGGGSSQESKVYAVTDKGSSGREVRVLAEGLESPNGVAFYKGDLYVAEISSVLKFTDVMNQDWKKPKYEKLPLSFPKDKAHGWKFIRFGPDGQLYVPVGAPCNICEPEADYARIFKVNIKAGTKTPVALGIRNSVGFDFHPVTKELWFTDNGRDLLGDDVPPDELNKLTKEGEHFGYPYCHGGGQNSKPVVDPQFPPADKRCDRYKRPELDLRAHSAALGMRFYTGTQFPEEYKNQIFFAEHGSWNRSTPQGYEIRRVHIKNGKAEKHSSFVSGWLQGRSAWGRPVDVEVTPEGALLISDDKAGVIYKVTYTVAHSTK